ncbi:MAG: beta galactosidase jelly roll domain-containing protein [Thermoleophilaceae bacterium]|nr:beta galactosidase jelly roll domain-containing protein [Thermoleophilaceae bacterium]
MSSIHTEFSSRAVALAAVLVSALLLALTPVSASAASDPSKGAPFNYGQTNRYTLDGTWFLKTDPTNAGRAAAYETTKNFASWKKITIPNAFNAGDASEASYTGSIAWYATQFNRPAAPGGSNWILQFNSANLRADVYLNGRRVGGHLGGNIPFEVPASSMKSGENTLIVRVDSRLSLTSVPSIEERIDQLTGGWWNFGGLLREVVLRRVGRYDVSSVSTRSAFKASKGRASGSARITVVANVKNYGRRGRLQLRGSYGNSAIRFRRTQLRSGATTQLVGTATVRNPKLWSPLSPKLYPVKVSAPGVTWTSKAGIRKYAVSSKGILTINGLRTRLRGVSFHESDLATGAAWSPAQREANNALFKKLGVNMIRTHYPMAPQQMEWADKNGVYVWLQVQSFRPRNPQLRSPSYRKQVVALTREMVARYRQYSSVLTWNLSNEAVPSDTKYLDALFVQQIKAVKALDPEGLISADYASAPEDELQHPAYRRMDILGINEYFGWYPGQLGSTLDMAGLRPYLDYLHRVYSKQALFITEFGAEANREGSADELGTYAYQTNFFTQQLSILRNVPYLNGLFAWALKDYWVRPEWTGGNPDPTPPFSRKGLFQADGTPKPAAALIEREFKATPPFIR